MRAVLTRFIHDLNTGNGKDACALLDANAQAQLSQISEGIDSCQRTVTVAQRMDTATATQSAQLAQYVKTVPITVRGDATMVPSTGWESHRIPPVPRRPLVFDNS